MKKQLRRILLILSCMSATIVNAQNAAINNNAGIAGASAILDISSPTKGLLIPRMSTASIGSISNPAKGLLVYDSVKTQLMVNMGTSSVPLWQTIVFNSGWSLIGNSAIDPAANFIGTTDNTPLSFRVNNSRVGLLD